jgi:hypothetical protein
MEGPKSKDTPRCENCQDCGKHGRDVPESMQGGLVGWRLALAAVGAFLVPLILGIFGSIVGGPGQNAKFLGALIGIAIGVLIAVVMARCFSGRSNSNPHIHEES